MREKWKNTKSEKHTKKGVFVKNNEVIKMEDSQKRPKIENEKKKKKRKNMKKQKKGTSTEKTFKKKKQIFFQTQKK